MYFGHGAEKKLTFRCYPNFLCVNINRWRTSEKSLVTSSHELHRVLNIQSFGSKAADFRHHGARNEGEPGGFFLSFILTILSFVFWSHSFVFWSHYFVFWSHFFVSFLLLVPLVIDNAFSRRLGQRKLQYNKVAWIYT